MKYARLLVLATVALAVTACGNPGGNSALRPDETDAVKASSINKQLGTAYLRQGNLALAKEKLERAEKYNAQDPELQSVLALLYERLNMPEQVDAHYRTAIRLAPKDPQVSNNYAVYLCRAGRTEEGVKRFLDAARNPLYRTPEAAYTNAGVCLRAAKRYDDASTTFQRALQIRPNYAEAVFQSADLELERGQFAQGREQVDKYLASFDATPELLLLGVQLNQALGDRLGAEKYTRRLRVEFPASQQLKYLSESKRNPG